MRKFIFSFLSSFVIIMTLSGFLVAGYRTKSALIPISSPVSLRISENGEHYIIIFCGEEVLLSRNSTRKMTNFFEKGPQYIPVTTVISKYITDKLDIFYRL